MAGTVVPNEPCRAVETTAPTKPNTTNLPSPIFYILYPRPLRFLCRNQHNPTTPTHKSAPVDGSGIGTPVMAWIQVSWDVVLVKAATSP